MALITTSPKPEPRQRRSRWPRGLAAGGAVVALAIVAGLGVWQGTAHRAGTRSQAPDQAAVAAPVRPEPARQNQTGLTVFLVGSAEQAVAIQERLDLAGAMPFDGAAGATLVVDPATTEGSWLFQALSARNLGVRGDGQSGVTVVDLRQ